MAENKSSVRNLLKNLIVNSNVNQSSTITRGVWLQYSVLNVWLDVDQNQDKKVDVEAQEINGIVYFLDKFNNVYNTEDIMKKIVNPRIIAKYRKTDDTYFIVDSVFVWFVNQAFFCCFFSII